VRQRQAQDLRAVAAAAAAAAAAAPQRDDSVCAAACVLVLGDAVAERQFQPLA